MNKTTGSTTILFLLGLVLRVWGILSRPIWYDEAIAMLFARAGAAGILYGNLAPDAQGNAASIHPPGYFASLAGWVRLFGESVVAGRVFSIVFGMLTLWLVYVLLVRLFDVRTAQWGLLFAALSPFHVHFSQEIRMYAMMTAFLLGAAVCLLEAMRTNRLRWWVGYAVCTALAQYTQNVAVLTLIPLAFTPLIYKDRKAFWRGALASVGGVVLYLPWLVKLPAQLAKIQNAYWTTTPGVGRVFTTLLSFVTNLPLSDAQLPIALFLTLFILVIAVWHTIKLYKQSPEDGKSGVWLGYITITPLVLMFVISQWQSVYIERGLLASGVFFALWVGWVVNRSDFHKLNKYTLVVCMLAAAAIGNYQHQTYAGFPYGPYQTLDETLVDAPGVVVHSNKLSFLPMFFLDSDLPQKFVADPPGSGADTLAVPTQEIMGIMESESIQQAVGEADEVWYLIFDRAIEEYQAAGESTHPDLAWLDTNFTQTELQTWDDLLLYHYER